MKINKTNLIILVIALLATIFFCYPYINKFTIDGHDFEFHVTRIQQISNEISQNNIPVLIHNDLVDGLGYANSIFYPELFLYIPAIIHLFGFTTVVAYKGFIFILTFLTFIFTFICARSISKNNCIGIIASMLYTFCLYRITDVYTRAALGEIIAFAFIPLIALGIYELLYKKEKKWWILPIGFFCVANSHIITFILAIIFVIAFLLINIRRILKEKRRIKYIIISGIVSVLIILSVVLPILEQKSNGEYRVFNGETSENLSEKSLLITQLFINEYQDTACRNNLQINNQMNFSNGIMLLILPLFVLITKWENKDEKNFIIKLLIIGIIMLLVTTVIFPWQMFEILNFIQLPWRLNIIISLCFSIVGSYCFYYSTNKNKNAMYIVAIIIIVTTAGYLDKVKYTDNLNAETTYNNIGQGEYLPSKGKLEENYVFDTNNKDNQYDFKREKGKVVIELTEAKNSKQLNIPLIYYKGYRAYITKQDKEEELKVELNENGMIRLNNDNLKTGTVRVEYKMTSIQIISYIISYTTLIVVILYIIIQFCKNKHLNKGENK